MRAPLGGVVHALDEVLEEERVALVQVVAVHHQPQPALASRAAHADADLRHGERGRTKRALQPVGEPAAVRPATSHRDGRVAIGRDAIAAIHGRVTERPAAGRPALERAVIERPRGTRGCGPRGGLCLCGRAFPRGIGAVGTRNGARGVLAQAQRLHRESDDPVRVLVRVRATRALHHAEQRVVVALRDVVELVVMAARAAGGGAEERLGCHVDLVVHALGLVEAHVHGRVRALRHPPPAGGGDALVGAVCGVQAWRGKQVAGHLLAHELRVRHVGVERANHPVAPAPRFVHGVVEFVAQRLRVAHHVHPVAAPAFAVARRGEERIHHALARGGRVVGVERAHGVRRRRQADDVEVDATEPGAVVDGSIAASDTACASARSR